MSGPAHIKAMSLLKKKEVVVPEPADPFADPPQPKNRKRLLLQLLTLRFR